MRSYTISLPQKDKIALSKYKIDRFVFEFFIPERELCKFGIDQLWLVWNDHRVNPLYLQYSENNTS